MTTAVESYNAEAIEVLTGLEPVQRRPGMYTDTTRPNHMAHEAIDNSIDEAIAGYAKQVDVTLYKDGSLEVVDNGRGMNSRTLRQALQFGGSSRFNNRSGLGRYGMGLPNSSLSQARCVDVYSSTSDLVS